MRPGTALLALAALAPLCACGTQSSAPLPAEGAGWGQIDQPPTAALAADPALPSAETPWPRAPAWARAYPGATIASVNATGLGAIVAFRTDDPPGAVIAFYRAAGRRAGLPQTELATDARHAALAMGREGRSLAVDASAVGGFTTVSLVFEGRR